MKKEPLVSIVMNCYNGEEYLKEAINSIIGQSYSNWEIIFWDNASTDKSREIALSYNNKLKYFYGEVNVPLGAARNLALEKCTGDYIAFLDVDDLWLPHKLEQQIKQITVEDNVVLYYTDGYYIYGNKRSSNKFSDGLFGKYYEGNVFEKLIKRNFINWQTVLINKKLANEKLYFNEKYRFAEDYDLLLRLSLVGNFVLLNVPLVCYRLHSKNMTNSLSAHELETRTIVETYSFEIRKRNMNYRKVIGLYYFYTIISFAKQKDIVAVKRMSPNLLKYLSLPNFLLYIVIILKLDIYIGSLSRLIKNSGLTRKRYL